MKQQWFCAQKRKELFRLWSCSYPISKILCESCETNPSAWIKTLGWAHTQSRRRKPVFPLCWVRLFTHSRHMCRESTKCLLAPHQVSLCSHEPNADIGYHPFSPPPSCWVSLPHFHTLALVVEGEIQPHERGSPTPTNFQNLSISFLHQPLFSQLWRFPHVFTQPLHSGHSNPSPWRGLNYHSIAPRAWCPYLKAEVETETQFHAQCSTGKRPT